LYKTSRTTFADNTTGDISASDLRTFGQDISDSLPFLSTAGTVITETDISSSQVLTGFSSPITVVNAPGALLALVPIAFFVHLDYTTSAYATNTTFRFEINGVAVSNTNTGMLPATTDRYAIMHGIDVDVSTNIVNQPIVLKVQGGNPTAGASALTVTTIYKAAYSVFP